MAVLSIREYEHIAAGSNGTVPVGLEPAVASQTLNLSGASAQSAAFNERTKFVRINTDIACSLNFGANPVAVAGGCNMAVSQTEYFGVQPGHKVAGITV